MSPSRTRLPALCLFFCAITALTAGCGGGDDGGGGSPGVTTLAITAEGMSDGNVPCPKDRGVSLGLEARADDGSSVAIDASRVTWEVDATGPTVSLAANGGTATATATKDWFDAAPPGAEPSTGVTACYDGLCDTVAVVGVIDATGTWVARLDNGITYPLQLTQSGRTITETTTGYTGSVSGNHLSLTVSGIAVSATFSSRTEVTGTYSGSGLPPGTLTCTKQ